MFDVKNAMQLIKMYKWYLILDICFILMLICEYFNPPLKDDQIWNAEATSNLWEYANQGVYIGSLRLDIIISILFLLLGISNMRNHPVLAKVLFLFPLYVGWIGIM